MSFQNLQHGSQSSQSSMLSKQWRGDDSSFDYQIKANIQEVQEAIRHANEHFHRMQGNHMAKRLGDSVDQRLKKAQERVQKTEQLFRDWTVQLAGEPTARHKKKFLYEKLQKAFREEVRLLKEASGRRYDIAVAVECHSVCEDPHSALSDEEVGPLLTDFEDSLNRNLIVREREESIKHIQSQVADVNEMFRSLASIVSEQEQPLLSIESQAESASSDTKHALVELKKASENQRSHFDRLCCIVASAMLALVLLMMLHIRESHINIG